MRQLPRVMRDWPDLSPTTCTEQKQSAERARKVTKRQKQKEKKGKFRKISLSYGICQALHRTSSDERVFVAKAPLQMSQPNLPSGHGLTCAHPPPYTEAPALRMRVAGGGPPGSGGVSEAGRVGPRPLGEEEEAPGAPSAQPATYGHGMKASPQTRRTAPGWSLALGLPSLQG